MSERETIREAYAAFVRGGERPGDRTAFMGGAATVLSILVEGSCCKSHFDYLAEALHNELESMVHEIESNPKQTSLPL